MQRGKTLINNFIRSSRKTPLKLKLSELSVLTNPSSDTTHYTKSSEVLPSTELLTNYTPKWLEDTRPKENHLLSLELQLFLEMLLRMPRETTLPKSPRKELNSPFYKDHWDPTRNVSRLSSRHPDPTYSLLKSNLNS